MKLKKYYEIFKFNLKAKIEFKTDYLFSLFSFIIHILVFNTLWDFILKDKSILGYTKPDLIWYIIIGEFLIFGASRNYMKISYMIKNGDIANLLTKPIDIAKYLFAEELSDIIKVAFNFTFAIVLGLIFAGVINITFSQLIIFLVSVLFSILIIMLIQILIGLLAFFTEDNEAFYLIVSKGFLLLVLTPLEFFPNLLQKVFLVLPTTYAVYPSSKIFVHFELTQSFLMLLGQIISICILLVVLLFLNKKGMEKINVNGG